MRGLVCVCVRESVVHLGGVVGISILFCADLFSHWEMVLENGIKVLRIVRFEFSFFYIIFVRKLGFCFTFFSSKIYNLQTGMLQYKIMYHFSVLFSAIFRLTFLYRVTVIVICIFDKFDSVFVCSSVFLFFVTIVSTLFSA